MCFLGDFLRILPIIDHHLFATIWGICCIFSSHLGKVLIRPIGLKGFLKKKNMYGNPIGRFYLTGFVSRTFARRILHTTKSAFQLRNDRSPADIDSIHPGR